MSDIPKHTPGPWRHETIQVKEFEEIGVRRKMFGADGQLMLWQEPYFKNPFDRLYEVVRLSDADWPLISAAPKMLEALKDAIEVLTAIAADDDAHAYSVALTVHAAIAKAEGRELP
jgi:hypothetical protein